jgi:hypothetical protein
MVPEDAVDASCGRSHGATNHTYKVATDQREMDVCSVTFSDLGGSAS